MASIEYQLSEAIKYGSKGQQTETTSVSLYAPSHKATDSAVKLLQAFKRAQREVMLGMVNGLDMAKIREQGEAEKENAKNNDKDKGSEYVELFLLSSTDVKDVLKTFGELLCTGAAKLDGSEKMTLFLFGQMDWKDKLQMMGEYFSNFLDI